MKWQPPSISLVWFGTGIFLVLELFCLWIFHYRWYDRETILFFASVVAGAFALYSYLKNIEEKRNETAGKFIERWSDPKMMEVQTSTRPFVERDMDCSEYARPKWAAKKGNSDEVKRRGHMLCVLNFFEEISIAVMTKSADEERLRRYFLAVVTSGYEGLEAFILAERKEDRDNAYYREVQKLVEKWTGVKRKDTL